jgi:ribosomal-protein-alanine N-acetyltransferase
MQITRASVLDLGALQRFDQVCFPEDGWNLPERLGVLLSPGVVRLKAVEEGRMAGFIVGRKPGADGVAWIRSVGVLPEYRRRGLARQLLRACEKRLHAARMRLFVRVSNTAAIRLYETEGYMRMDLRAGFYGGGEAAVIMEKTLSAEAESSGASRSGRAG